MVFWLLQILLMFALPVRALDVEQRVHHYARQVLGTREGLPQGSVYAVAQTPDGFVWLGTQEGLVRYDGRELRVFDRSNVPAMRASWVWALHVDRRGDLWIGTYSGGLLRLSHGRFEAFTQDTGLPSNKIRAIAEDQGGHLWIGTMGGGLARWENGRFTVFRAADGLGSNEIFALLPDGDGGLWIGTHGAGLVHKTEAGWRKLGVAEGLPSDRVLSLLEDSDGALWIGTTAGLCRWHDGHLAIWRKADGLPDDVVRSLQQDRDGNLWVGTLKGGLTRRVKESFETLSLADGLPQESVLCLFEDSESNFWVGTNGGGVLMMRSGRVSTFTTRDGLAHDITKALLLDRSGRLWVGSTAGLACLENGQPVAFPGQLELRGETINALAQTAVGTIWVATQGSGLYTLDETSVRHLEEPEELVGLKSFTLLEDRAGVLWLGTQGQGLLNYSGGKVQRFGEAQGLDAPVIWRLFEDHASRLWVGTSQGLYLKDGERFRRIDAGADPYNSTVLSFYEDEQGRLWAGTLGGGICLVRNETLVPVRKENGLYDDAAFEMLADGRGGLWTTSNKGLVRIDYESLVAVATQRAGQVSVEVLGLHDGLLSTECNGGVHRSGVATPDGRLWFSTMAGLAMVDPGRVPRVQGTPQIHIEKLVVDEVEHAWLGRVTLPPQAEKLEVWYTAPSFVAPERVSYEYRLDGLDDDWVVARDRRVAYYSNLRSGDYVFRVRARNAAGVPSAGEAKIELRKQPFFYETVWFYLLVVGAGLAGVLLVFRLRVAAIASRNIELERLVAEKTEELRAANDALKEQSLRDPLTQLRNRRYLHEVVLDEFRASAGSLARPDSDPDRRARGSSSGFGILVLDIDFFKRVNDRYGHQAGDVLLRTVADVLIENVRSQDVVIRWGGEEFLVLLRHIDVTAATTKADDLRLRVAGASAQLGLGVSLSVTVSIGVAAFPFLSEDPQRLSFEQCIGIADLGLLRAKASGRDRTVEVISRRPPATDSEQELLTKSLDDAEKAGLVSTACLGHGPGQEA